MQRQKTIKIVGQGDDRNRYQHDLLNDPEVTAVRSLAKFNPDILLSDIGMPEMDGYALIQAIRSSVQNRSLPAIALTAYAGELARPQAIAAGFQYHIAKPIDPDTLIKTVTALIHDRHQSDCSVFAKRIAIYFLH